MTQNLFNRHASSVFVDGTEVPYFSAGDPQGKAPVLVMVHGSTGSTDSHYGYLFPMLSFRQRVVSIDLRPPAQGGELTLAHLVRQVGAVIDAVGCGQPVALMGYSLGAVVAAAVAAERPSDVRQLLLVAGWIKTDGHQQLRNGIWRQLRRAGSEAIRHYMLFCAFSAGFVGARTPQELTAIANKITLDGFVDQQMDLNSRIDISEVVSRIRATTLVVGCTQDQMVPRTHSQQLFGAIEDARYTEIDSGHAVVFERPAELLRLIDQFLRNPTAHPAGSLLPAARP